MKTLESVFDVNYDSITDDAIQKLKEWLKDGEISFEGSTIKITCRFLQLDPIGLDLIHKVYSLQGCNLLQFNVKNPNNIGVNIDDDKKGVVYDFKEMNLEMLCGLHIRGNCKIKNANILSDYTITIINLDSVELENVNIISKEIDVTNLIPRTVNCNLECKTMIFYTKPSKNLKTDKLEEHTEWVEKKIGWSDSKGWNLKKLNVHVRLVSGNNVVLYYSQIGKHLKYVKMREK